MSDEWVTASGKRLTDEDIQALAAEAEQGYDVSKIKERYVVLREADFRRMSAPRAMNMATAQAHTEEWHTLTIADAVVKLRSELILDLAADQMYVWADERGNVQMDCPHLDCGESIYLGYTPTVAQMREAAREHVRERHAGGPIVLHIEPEGPVHDSERGGSMVDDPAS